MAKCNRARKWCRDIGCYHSQPHRRTSECGTRECQHAAWNNPTVKCMIRKPNAPVSRAESDAAFCPKCGAYVKQGFCGCDGSKPPILEMPNTKAKVAKRHRNGDSLQCLIRQGKAWIRKSRHFWGGVLLRHAHDVYWEVGVSLPDGTRKRTYGETQREARQKMREFLANVAAETSAAQGREPNRVPLWKNPAFDDLGISENMCECGCGQALRSDLPRDCPCGVNMPHGHCKKCGGIVKSQVGILVVMTADELRKPPNRQREVGTLNQKGQNE